MAERRRVARAKKPESVAQTAKEATDGARVDDFLASLRNKPDLGRRSQRRAGKPTGDRLQRLSSPLGATFTSRDGDPVDKARGLLAQLTGNEVSGAPVLRWFDSTSDRQYAQLDDLPLSPRTKPERRQLRSLNMSTDTPQAPSLGEVLEVPQEAKEDDLDASSESDYNAESEAEEGEEARSDVGKGDDEDADMTMKLQELVRKDMEIEISDEEKQVAGKTRGTDPGQEDELLLSDLSEDEALAASLA